MQFVILAAGLGTRLMPLTAFRSKLMLPVANKPFLEWTVDALNDMGDVTIVLRKDQEDMTSHFKNCRIVYQEAPLGTANAIACCKDIIDDRFVVINGDEFIPKDDIEKFSRLEGYNIAIFPGNSARFGTLSVVGGIVTGIAEKCANGTALINAGMYMFEKNVFESIEKTKLSSRGEYEITDSIRILIENGVKIKTFRLSRWNTLGYPWDLLDINQELLKKTGSIIGDNVEIRPGSYIEHPVAIGDGSIIGPNCYIRKYSSIGKNCKVGNAVEIKNSIIMDNSFVSHLSYVGDSVVGSNCNIGAGTIFANLRLDDKHITMVIKNEKTDSGRRKLGAFVGDNVKFGVNVTLMPGKKIWPDLLIPPCIMIKDDLEKQPGFNNP